ncbi:hypothetical protein ACWDTT_34000, partial [Streptosporangium sandarakinum]
MRRFRPGHRDRSGGTSSDGASSDGASSDGASSDGASSDGACRGDLLQDRPHLLLGAARRVGEQLPELAGDDV